MSNVNKKRLSPGVVTVLVLAGLIELGIVINYMLIGRNVNLFSSQGFIAHAQHNLFVQFGVLLCLAAVPVVLFLYFTAWKFRESNTKAVHTPDARHGKFLVFSIWAYPIMCFFFFSALLIPATFQFAPQKAIADGVKPLTIQVVAMRWKWLFLYPEQHIATVNYVQIPKDRPIIFELTADDAPMTSFWIPNIGGQLYAMTGMVNRLNLMADKVGEYKGTTAEINGAGFGSMNYVASVSTATDFNSWSEGMRQSGKTLDNKTYNALLKPSENVPPAFYGSYQDGLYDTVVMKYMGHMHMHEHEGHE